MAGVIRLVAVAVLLLPSMLRAQDRDAPSYRHLSAARQHADGGRYQKALGELDQFVQRGGSEAVADLERSRALAGLARWSDAVTAYRAGLRELDAAGRTEYRADIAWIAREEETAQFDSLPLAAAGPWIDQFFLERDALELRPPGARLQEHLRRVIHAYRQYLLQRPGDKPSFAQGFERRDFLGERGNPGRDSVVLLLSEPIPRFPTYQRTQWDLDDRGVIYIRHGEPTARERSVAGPPNESWKYDLPDGPLIFHFIGSKALGISGATTLVASLPMDAEMLSARSALDLRYEALAQRVVSQLYRRPSDPTDRLSNEMGPVLQQEILRNQRAIAIGVSTDGFPHVFKRSLEAGATFYGVGLAPGETRRILAVVAVPERRATVRLAAIDQRRGLIRQLDTVFALPEGDSLARGAYLTGTIELPVPVGDFEVRALIATPAMDAGSTARREHLEISGSRSTLDLSDLILGRDGNHRWRYAGVDVALNPLNSFARGADAELFYEAAGLVPGAEYRATLAIRRPDDKPEARPAIEVITPFTAQAAYQQFKQGVGLAQLEPGRYILQVTVTEATGDRAIVRRQALNIQDK